MNNAQAEQIIKMDKNYKMAPSMLDRIKARIPVEYHQAEAELDMLTSVQPFTHFLVVTTQLMPAQLATLELGNVQAPKLMRMSIDYGWPMTITASTTLGLNTFAHISAQLIYPNTPVTWLWQHTDTNTPLTNDDDILLAAPVTQRLTCLLPAVSKLQRLLANMDPEIRVFAASTQNVDPYLLQPNQQL